MPGEAARAELLLPEAGGPGVRTGEAARFPRASPPSVYPCPRPVSLRPLNADPARPPRDCGEGRGAADRESRPRRSIVCAEAAVPRCPWVWGHLSPTCLQATGPHWSRRKARGPRGRGGGGGRGPGGQGRGQFAAGRPRPGRPGRCWVRGQEDLMGGRPAGGQPCATQGQGHLAGGRAPGDGRCRVRGLGLLLSPEKGTGLVSPDPEPVTLNQSLQPRPVGLPTLQPWPSSSLPLPWGLGHCGWVTVPCRAQPRAPALPATPTSGAGCCSHPSGPKGPLLRTPLTPQRPAVWPQGRACCRQMGTGQGHLGASPPVWWTLASADRKLRHRDPTRVECSRAL